MPVRVGVDVGGTFTKAVACDAASGAIVARSIVPTTHGSPTGLAEGIVAALDGVLRQTKERGLGPIALVSHSTTQAVNALLEGDTAVVGILGMGRRPDLRRARRRTRVGDVRLAPGRKLETRHRFLDVTERLDPSSVRAALSELEAEGAEVACISEAFGVDDARGEWIAVDAARERGLMACAGHELTGLYGLEMRTVTAALNASILPAAARTARLVEEALAVELPGVPLLMMRGDGGAANMTALKNHPLLTAFSGPAASVAGALRHLRVHDGIVIEVGGTSTNVSAIKGGRPVLSYVRVLDHVTSVRSLDVRVAGVAGGSLLRVARSFGRIKFADVGPRSAHIAGLGYCSFARAEDLDGGTMRLIAPRPGDPESYVVVETRAGRLLAPTLTCAANATGDVAPGSYASADPDAARAAFDVIGTALGVDGTDLARRVVNAAAARLALLCREVASEHELATPDIVGVGGGAGALVPAMARGLRQAWSIPKDAEIISSIGDALSLLRVEVERTLNDVSPAAIASVHEEAEAAALDAGVSPASLQIESEAVPQRGALRVTAFGALALDVEADARSMNRDEATSVARRTLGGEVDLVFENLHYRAFVAGTRFAIVDRHGTVVTSGTGEVVVGSGGELAATLQERFPRLVKNFGPIAVAPAIKVLRGTRLVDLSLFSAPKKAEEALLAECAQAGDSVVAAFVVRD